MKKLLFLLFCHVSSSVKHSGQFSSTGLDGVPNMPDFVVTAEFDEMPVYYCDSNKTTRSYPSFWEKADSVALQVWAWSKQYCFDILPALYSVNINRLREFNPKEAVHILQCMNRCEWDDETGDVHSIIRCGYNGEDFLEMDLKNVTWVPKNPLGEKITSRSKNNINVYYAQLATQKCPEWIKELVATNTLKKTDPVSVSLLQKTPSSPVSCHATGFFPNSALMFWRKDGEETHEYVELGDILPNHDGTFQMIVGLNVSSIPAEDWWRYDCVFQFSGEENKITTELDKRLIRTNWVSASKFPPGAVIGCSVGLLLLLLCITGLCIWKKKYMGFRPANTSDCPEKNFQSK